MKAFQLVYVSAAHGLVSAEDFGQLLTQARTNNARRNITGILLHDSGSFLQVLEGAEQEVESVFRRIEADPRHRRVLVLARQPVATRSFGEWSMGFVNRTPSLAHLPGFKDASRDGLVANDVGAMRTHAFYLLEAFSVGRLRQFVNT